MNEKAQAPSEKQRSVAFTHSRPAITVDGELPLLERREFTGMKGGHLEYDVLAEFTSPNNQRSIVICAKQGMTGVIVVENGTQIVEGNTLNSGKERWVKISPDGTAAISVKQTIDKRGKMHWEFRYAGSQPTTSMTMSDDRSLLVKTRKYDYVEHQKKGKKIAKRIAGAVAIFATLAPNGPIDWAVDASTNSADIVDAAAQLDTNANPNSSVRKEAVAKVKSLMQAIDEGNFAIVKDEGDTFAAEKASFIPKDQIIAIEESINGASSMDDITQAMNRLIPYVNITFEYGDEKGHTELPTLEEVRYTAGQIVEELAQTPLSLFNTELRTVVLTGKIKAMKTVLGYTSGTMLAVVCKTKEAEGQKVVADKILADPFGVSRTIKNTWRHEFAHTRRSGAVGNAELLPTTDDQDIMIRALGAAPQLLFNSPPGVSIYALTDKWESAAESFAAAQNVKDGDYANPNDGRKYYSNANKLVLANLLAMEEIQPGMAAYYLSR